MESPVFVAEPKPAGADSERGSRGSSTASNSGGALGAPQGIQTCWSKAITPNTPRTRLVAMVDLDEWYPALRGSSTCREGLVCPSGCQPETAYGWSDARPHCGYCKKPWHPAQNQSDGSAHN